MTIVLVLRQLLGSIIDEMILPAETMFSGCKAKDSGADETVCPMCLPQTDAICNGLAGKRALRDDL